MEIVPGIHQVDGINGNAYVLVRDGLIVIDTGIPGSGKKILAYISDVLHRDPSEIRTVLITHFHLDHIGGLAALKSAAPHAKIAIGEADAGYLAGTMHQPVHSGLRGLLLRIAGIVMNPGTFTADLLLQDGRQQEGLLCLHLPGHTPGSFGFLDEKTGVLFAGDLLRYDGAGISRGPEQFTMDREMEIQSIRKVAGMMFEILLPGHGVPLRPGASAKVREFAGQPLPG